MRNKTQWLEMIARTRPTRFAVNALETQLGREAAQFDAAELKVIRAALSNLEDQILKDTPAQTTHTGAVLNVDYRPEGMGGKGRIYAEVEGRKLRDLLENTVLDDAQVYVFLERGAVAGIQVDNANTLPERLETVLTELEALNLERVDCPEAGLEEARVTEVLRWVVTRLELH
ncbi:MAG: hypothetical protein HC933_04840 [Pleurocapsa sp. SU_196_0]|nr:hypothetical protein [Pleurocapsa sp. SU_196_0]